MSDPIVLARRFGDALRVGDGRAAERIVDDALAAGLEPAVIQSLVIAPAMVRIGELWEQNVIGVAEEHLATSICQRALVPLFETMLAAGEPRRRRERILLAAVEGQQHVVGLQMIADVLEAAGYDVLNLGASVPLGSLLQFIASQQPAIVGLAFGSAHDIRALTDSLWATHEVAPDARVMLGGLAVPRVLREAGYRHVVNSIDVVTAVKDLLASAPLQPSAKAIEPLHLRGADVPGPGVPPAPAAPVAEAIARNAEATAGLAREHIRRADTYRRLALSDPLTGLGNRRRFEQDVRGAAARPGAAAALVISPEAETVAPISDAQVQRLGGAIRGALREADTVARLGGAEFAAVLPGATAAAAAAVAARIRASVAAIAAVRITVSEVGASPLEDGVLSEP